MTEQEFDKKIESAAELAADLNSELGDQLNVVENDGRFIKDLGEYKTEDQGVIPKWERRSVICLWGESKTLLDALLHHQRSKELCKPK